MKKRKPTDTGLDKTVAPSSRGFTGNPGQHTGRFLVVLREGAAVRHSISTVRNLSGVSMASASDFSESAEHRIDTSLFFDQLGIAVCNADPGQYASLAAAAADEGNADILAIEPELICGTCGPDATYLRGYRDGVNDLSNRLGIDDGAERETATAAAADESRFTWGLQATGGSTSRFSGNGIKIAVLDTGFDLRHPDFAGRRIRSRSFVGGTAQDRHGHGTHCIGTACGPQSPAGGRPRFGIAYNSAIFAGKVLNDQGSGGDGTILQGMDWAVANGCEVISMSLRSIGPASAAYEAAGRRALNAGCLVIAAAGNDSARPGRIAPVGRPANSESVMAVAALDNRLRLAPFSNGGTANGGGKIDIAGPGVTIFSTAPGGTTLVAKDGTSMATPHVAGIAALFAEARPAARGLALKALLTQTARALSLPATAIGSGLVQAPQ